MSTTRTTRSGVKHVLQPDNLMASFKPKNNVEFKNAVKNYTQNENSNGYPPIGSWDVSNVTRMSRAFYEASRFNEDISNWNVSNVTSMKYMFFAANSFNQPLNNWNVSNVTNMNHMFSGAMSFNQPLNNWNVSNVTSMNETFSGASSFNQPLDNWNVSNVTSMEYMFYGASSFNQPLNNWNVSNVTSMEYMFYGASSFNQPLNNWNVSNVTNMTYMFSGTSSFDQPLNNWNIANVQGINNLWQIFSGSGISNYNLPPFRSPQQRAEITQNVTRYGIAYQVHNSFNNIDFNRLLTLINNGTVVNTSIPNKFNEYMKNELKELLNNYTNKTEAEELNTKFQSLVRKINSINYNATDFKIISNPTPESVFLTILKFIKEQPKQYQDNYIKMFIDESYSAYNTGDDQTSCVKGIKERIIFALGQAGFNIDNSLYKQISETLFPIKNDNIYAFISSCVQEKQKELETLGDNLEGKKALITNCLIQKIQETYSNIDVNLLQERITNAINASQDMLGGRKRRKKGKTRKMKKRKTRKTKKRITSRKRRST